MATPPTRRTRTLVASSSTQTSCRRQGCCTPGRRARPPGEPSWLSTTPAPSRPGTIGIASECCYVCACTIFSGTYYCIIVGSFAAGPFGAFFSGPYGNIVYYDFLAAGSYGNIAYFGFLATGSYGIIIAIGFLVAGSFGADPIGPSRLSTRGIKVDTSTGALFSGTYYCIIVGSSAAGPFGALFSGPYGNIVHYDFLAAGSYGNIAYFDFLATGSYGINGQKRA